MPSGYIIFVLHAHLPYVRRPEYEEFLEERWLFEGMFETYIPLLKMFKRLENDGVNFRLTMSITPPLMEMLTTKDLMDKFERHMKRLIELVKKEVERTAQEDPRKHKTAQYYLKDFQETLEVFYSYDRNMLNGFKEYMEKGKLDILTCNATHGYLPLMEIHPYAVKAQVKIGVDTYKKYMGVKPRGIWLAECAYYPGLDKILAEYGLEYFFVDSHGFWYADERPHYGVYRPVVTPNDVFVFARDPESSELVWSADAGYPGDGRYREFYRDIGFDREYEYIKPYIDKSGVRINTGIKYHKITDKSVPLSDKDYYDIDEALQAVKEHASDFISKKLSQTHNLKSLFNGVEPVIVAPFDAELFGHWWYEGVYFLEEFFRNVTGTKLRVATAGEIVDRLETVQIVTPAASSWGANGYNEVWLNGKTDWIYPHQHEFEERMREVAQNVDESNELMVRLAKQLARELLLLQSSDWAFIITTGTSVNYAVDRIKEHAQRFFELYDMYKSGNIDEKKLSYYEWIDGIFPDVDYKVYAI
ncbi:MAG: DUF1957 domain-containing protein [Thermotogaceae bacterium]|nr:DUF1957 domain-containing protein [Thermotogaceae bacterium]